MENKEAVGILKKLQEPEAWEPQITEKTFEALGMAIMALERSDDKSRFFTLEYDFQYSIKVDRDTGVMYAVSNGNNNAGTFTPLINADGKPLIYKQIIKESDLVKMGVIEPGEIKAGQVGPIEQLKNLLEKAESEPPIIEGSVLEDLLVPVGLVKEIISEQPDIAQVQSPPISKMYAKAVRSWLVNYQVKLAELDGRYTPYEVLGWVVSDWRKENGIW